MEKIQEEVQVLLDQAMKQPGVTEIMELHAAQKSAIDAYAGVQEAIAPRWVIYSSASSVQRKI